jgi:hypothetical protein
MSFQTDSLAESGSRPALIVAVLYINLPPMFYSPSKPTNPSAEKNLKIDVNISEHFPRNPHLKGRLCTTDLPEQTGKVQSLCVNVQIPLIDVQNNSPL